MEEALKPTTFRLPKSEWKQLKNLAMDRDASIQELVSAWVKEQLAALKPAAPSGRRQPRHPDRRPHFVGLRLSEAEYARLQAQAESLGLTVSDQARRKLFGGQV